MKKAKIYERKIHIALTEDIHKLLRVKCALQEVSMQDYVFSLLKESVTDVVIAQSGKKAIVKENQKKSAAGD